MKKLRLGLNHATVVSIGNRGILIIGKSGSGKSSLAVELISLGAKLVADDQVYLRQVDNQILAQTPQNLSGLIEMRGIGIAELPFEKSTFIKIVVDLDEAVSERVPNANLITIGSTKLASLAGLHILNLSAKLFVLMQSPSGEVRDPNAPAE